MVCKINFDYEISLSGDNDSISSSEFSTDDESLNKKFVLGDNILDVNPLKIISVRQLNNLNNSNSNESISEIQINDENHNKNVPLNNYLCYDESISNFEEESVSESELNLYYNPVTLTESEFNFSNTHLKYELPIVNRFQMLPQQVVKESENIDSISQYCMKEKLNRLQIKHIALEKANQTLSNKDSETELNFVKNKATKIRSIENNVTVSNPIENSTISPEILSGLSIDVLTKFINGEKSAEEIMNQINKNSNKKRKKPKKLKRHNNEKYSKKYSVKQNSIPTTTIESIESVESIVIPKQSESESLIGNSLINTKLLSPLDFNSNETEIIDEVPLENCKVIDSDNKYDTEVMERKITSPIIQLPECINVDNSINDKEIFTEISNENDKSKDSQQIFKSGKESESCLSNHHHESFGFISNCNEELSENKQISVLNSPELLNEEISKVSLFQQCETSVTKDNHNNNNDDDKTVNRIEEKYENKSNQYSDECKDLRTPSTDSGFHDCDNDETNDEVQIKINKSQPLIADLQCSKIENKTEKTENINIENNAQIMSMKKFLDFSSFKFKFINKSNLRNIDRSNSPLREISSENKNTISVTDKSLKSNILNNADKYCQKITDSSLSLSPLSSASFNNNQFVNEHTPTDVDYYLFQSEHSNTSNSTKPNSNSKNETSKIIDKLPDSITDTNFTTIAYQIPSTKSYQYHHRYHPFKVDYYSPEAAITNKEEISEFLDFQWLKFCEKYTICNHNMNIL